MNTTDIRETPRNKWILIANRAGAKLFAADGGIAGLNSVRAIPFPDGRKQNHEIDTDDYGSRLSSVAGRGNRSAHGKSAPSRQQKHGLDPHEEAVAHKANVFARELCRVLYDGRTHGEFEELVLVAEPHFLGRLRTFLDKATSHRVVASVNHNWIDLDESLLREKLHAVIEGA